MELLEEEWIKEANIREILCRYLESNGYTIENPHHKNADKGCDIKAVRADKRLIIELKGYPSKLRLHGNNAGTEKSPGYRRNQAKGWIKKGIGQLIFYKSEPENKSYEIALGLPYHGDFIYWIKCIGSMLNKLDCDCYFVDQDGDVKTLKDVLR